MRYAISRGEGARKRYKRESETQNTAKKTEKEEKRIKKYREPEVKNNNERQIKRRCMIYKGNAYKGLETISSRDKTREKSGKKERIVEGMTISEHKSD